MATLLERTTVVGAALVRLRGSQLSATSRSLVKERKRELTVARERLEAPLRFIRAVEAQESLTMPAGKAIDLSPALLLLGRARATAREDPEGLLGGPGLTHLLAGLKSLANTAESAAADVWRRTIVAMMPAPPTELLDVLAQIPAHREGVEELRALDRRVKAVTALGWPSEEELGTFLELGRRAQEWWQALRGQDGLPDGVLNFLVACAHDGAPVGDLTAAISDWITSRGLADVFRIRFKA